MIRAVAVLVLAAAAGLLWSRRAAAAVVVAGDDFGAVAGWSSTVFYPPQLQVAAGESNGPALPEFLPALVVTSDYFLEASNTMDETEAQKNIAAFLMMVRAAEHPGDGGPDDYRRIFGGGLFDSYADHPRKLVTETFGNGVRVTSDAAGAYQFISTTWDDARRATGVPDFSPASQDIAALWLIRRRGALDDVRQGRFADAVRKCAREWASLPGSPYGQPTITEAKARELYAGAGGQFA